jgi:branched-chain amino acid transport system substrate-binding protein
MVNSTVLRLGVVATAAVLVTSACGGSSKKTTTTPSSSSSSSSSSAAGPALTKSAIKIGNPGTYSGFSGATSKAGADALDAWAKWTNAHGGINGHPVQVITKDDGGSASKALANVKSLVESDHVVAIVGEHESGLDSTWAPYIQSKNIPVIGGSGTGAVWLTNPMFFPGAATAITGLTGYAYTTKLAKKSKYGLIYCAEAPACAQAGTLSGQLSQKIGVDYVGGVAVSASSPSYTAQCISLRSKGADIVFTATALETSVRFINDCAKQSYKPTWIDVPQNWTPDQASTGVWEGSWLVSDSVSWLSTTGSMKDYATAMKQYAPNAIWENSTATASWAAGTVLADALKNASDNVTSAEILQGLYALGPNYTAGGVIPPTTYNQGKPATQSKACVWYMQVVNKKVTSPEGTDAVCVPGY